MIPPEFKYSSKAHYSHAAFKVKTVDIVDQNIIVKSDGSFKVSFPNILEKYKLPYVESDALVNRWRTDWMQFWQNQLHFAVWCATTGCGVDFNHHLKAEGIGSMFMFHVYYQIRRILKEINAALPQDASWNAFDNSYDRAAYERICKEFGIDVSFDWRQKQSDNQGLGFLYNYWTNAGYHFLGRGTEYDTRSYSFTQIYFKRYNAY